MIRYPEINEGATVIIDGLEHGGKGLLTIDSVINGRCCGGVRAACGSFDDREIPALAENMTLKLGFLGVIPRGGCKMGVILPETAFDRTAYFRRIGSMLAKHLKSRKLALGTDLGTYPEDLVNLYSGAGIKVSAQSFNSSYYTAVSVSTAVEYARGIVGIKNIPIRVAVEGFGKVGSEVARILAARGMRITAVSNKHGALYCRGGLDIEAILREYRINGDAFMAGRPEKEKIPYNEIFSLPEIDFFIPCSTSHVMKDSIAGNFSAKAVIPASNIPADKNTVQLLAQKGVFFMPDFISNSGGIFGTFLNNLNIPGKSIERLLSVFLSEKMHEFVKAAQSLSGDFNAGAAKLALDRFGSLKYRYEHSIMRYLSGSGFLNTLAKAPLINGILVNRMTRGGL